MIMPIVRTSLIALRRDRGARALSFILPVAFFTIFALIFGARRDTLPRVAVLVVDEDHSTASQKLVKSLEDERSLNAYTRPAAKDGVEQPDFAADSAETEVKEGHVSVALIIPHGYGKDAVSSSTTQNHTAITMLKDSSDMVAPQVIVG